MIVRWISYQIIMLSVCYISKTYILDLHALISTWLTCRSGKANPKQTSFSLVDKVSMFHLCHYHVPAIGTLRLLDYLNFSSSELPSFGILKIHQFRAVTTFKNITLLFYLWPYLTERIQVYTMTWYSSKALGIELNIVAKSLYVNDSKWTLKLLNRLKWNQILVTGFYYISTQ